MAIRNEKHTEFQYPVRISRELRDALYERAEREDRPISRIIREAIRSYLAQPEGRVIGGA